eukprot:1576676-Rhodomonas_salina.2
MQTLMSTAAVPLLHYSAPPPRSFSRSSALAGLGETRGSCSKCARACSGAATAPSASVPAPPPKKTQKRSLALTVCPLVRQRRGSEELGSGSRKRRPH